LRAAINATVSRAMFTEEFARYMMHKGLSERQTPA